ncbi:hypothetical protein A3Q33_09680 [Colwellia sp. PAMC 21821]|nr:hypothetical protein A3Q33_09680 [Colwellia sp. PAMC 21821]
MKFKYPLLISIVISLSAGYIGTIGYFLGISRTLYFFPFFILGYKLGSAFLTNKYLIKIPKVFYFAMLIFNLIVFWWFKDLPHQWLFGSFSYEKLGNMDWYSFIIRSLLYFISFISSVAILMLMPNKESAFTIRGQNSLFVYVWHGFFVKVAIYIGIIQFLSNTSNILALIALFISALLLTFFLSSRTVATITNSFFLLPAQTFLLKK